MLKAPKFWYEPPRVLARLLLPLGWVYGGVVSVYQALQRPQKIACPVISIGNLVMGGSGKTPTTIALAALLREMGEVPHIITRGYGGRERGPLRVDPRQHTFQDVGDESLLLARSAPTWVSQHRAGGAMAAIQEGATMVLLDDGHQNHHLQKDLSLLVMDGQQKCGNGLVFPAGPLREFEVRGMDRAQGIVWVSREKDNFSKPTFEAVLKPTYEKNLLESLVVAFSGLGFNQKFHETLRAEHFHLKHVEEFPDHHPYTEKDLEYLLKIAHNKGAKLVTTAKDAVRVPPSFRDRIHVIEVQLEFENSEDVKAWLASQNLH